MTNFDRRDRLVVWSLKTGIRAFLFGMLFPGSWLLLKRLYRRHKELFSQCEFVCPFCKSEYSLGSEK